MKLLTSLALCAGFATSALHAKETGSLTLYLVPGLCPQAQDILLDWAKGTTSYAAFAVPTPPFSSRVSCDAPPDPEVKSGVSYGAANRADADKAALEVCNRLRPAGYRACVVIARLEAK